MEMTMSRTRPAIRASLAAARRPGARLPRGRRRAPRDQRHRPQVPRARRRRGRHHPDPAGRADRAHERRDHRRPRPSRATRDRPARGRPGRPPARRRPGRPGPGRRDRRALRAVPGRDLRAAGRLAARPTGRHSADYLVGVERSPRGGDRPVARHGPGRVHRRHVRRHRWPRRRPGGSCSSRERLASR